MISPKLKRFIVTAILMISVAFAYGEFEHKDIDGNALNGARHIILTDSRAEHILYGDATGGGHRHGAGKPCKSEFPRDWSDTKIIETAKNIAANDNLNWRQEYNGYQVTEAWHDNVKVRVVINPRREEIITAYPTNLSRNPCPARAVNDNFNE